MSGKPWREDIAVDEILDIRKCHMHMKETYQNIENKAVCDICMSGRKVINGLSAYR